MYRMHIISLKDFEAEEIFNTIENKLKNNEVITDKDIASLQLIIYTEYDESKLKILNKARKLIEEISESLVFDINEKLAIIYLFNVLSANMLDEQEYNQYAEVNTMLINPMERYMKKKGIEEGIEEGIQMNKQEIAKNMLDDGFSIEKIVQITGLSKEDIMKAK